MRFSNTYKPFRIVVASSPNRFIASFLPFARLDPLTEGGVEDELAKEKTKSPSKTPTSLSPKVAARTHIDGMRKSSGSLPATPDKKVPRLLSP